MKNISPDLFTDSGHHVLALSYHILFKTRTHIVDINYNLLLTTKRTLHSLMIYDSVCKTVTIISSNAQVQPQSPTIRSGISIFLTVPW